LASGGLKGTATVTPSDGRALADAIDLSRPWFEPWLKYLSPVLEALRRGDSVADALNGVQVAGLDDRVEAAGRVTPGLRFVPQADLPQGEAYEAFIYRTRSVPTRDNLHDLFNGVCWLRFPAIKRRLNALQAEQISLMGVGATRGPVRDALTLFDENALLLSGPAALRQALQAHDWQALFVHHRDLWAQARCVVFGHALLEKLVQPYKSITAHVLWVDGPGPAGLNDGADPANPDAVLDGFLPGRLSPEYLGTKPFMPLPVLGLPGWCAGNEDPDFYQDRGVFRPRRIPHPLA
jgi:hypothetical protein